MISCQKAPWDCRQLILVRVQGHMADCSNFHDVYILTSSSLTTSSATQYSALSGELIRKQGTRLVHSTFYFLSLTSSTYCSCRRLLLHAVTLSRTPLNKRSTRRRKIYPTMHNIHKREKKKPCPRRDSNPQSQQASGQRSTP